MESHKNTQTVEILTFSAKRGMLMPVLSQTTSASILRLYSAAFKQMLSVHKKPEQQPSQEQYIGWG